MNREHVEVLADVRVCLICVIEELPLPAVQKVRGSGQLRNSGNSTTAFFVVREPAAGGDFTLEVDITTQDNDLFGIVWNFVDTGDYDYVMLNGGDNDPPGNESITWSGSGDVYTGLQWVTGDTLFVRVTVESNTATVWVRNVTGGSTVHQVFSGNVASVTSDWIGVVVNWNDYTQWDDLAVSAVATQLYCERDFLPSPEVCNGDDDDCDGSTDEGC